MKMKSWFLLIGVTFVAILILLTLTFYIDKPNIKKNGFTRNLKNNIFPLHKITTDKPLNRIAGYTEDYIYFIDKQANKLTIFDWELKQLGTTTFSKPFSQNLLTSYKVEVDSPWVTFYAGNLSSRISYHWYDTIVKGTIFKTPIFTRAVSISDSLAVLRAFDSTKKKQIFKTVHTYTGQIIAEADIIPQTDGGFSTDGWLLYDDISHTIMYISIYENKFYSLNTNLQHLYTSKTIDTVNHNPVETHHFSNTKTDGSLKPAIPLLPINRDACVCNGRLYIVSALQAENEAENEFRSNTVVDVYNILDGQYLNSFYIPNIKGEKLKYMRVINNKIIALYKNNIGVFDIKT